MDYTLKYFDEGNHSMIITADSYENALTAVDEFILVCEIDAKSCELSVVRNVQVKFVWNKFN